MSGFEPTKVINLIVISLFSGLPAIGVVWCVVTGGFNTIHKPNYIHYRDKTKKQYESFPIAQTLRKKFFANLLTSPAVTDIITAQA